MRRVCSIRRRLGLRTGSGKTEDLRVGARAPSVRRAAEPCPQPQRRLPLLVNRAGVDEVGDLSDGETRLDLAVDCIPIVPKRHGPSTTRDRHSISTLLKLVGLGPTHCAARRTVGFEAGSLARPPGE